MTLLINILKKVKIDITVVPADAEVAIKEHNLYK